ncbi:MAG: hypothetical protein JSU82_13560, partial [Rhodospirillales bacterium]
MKNPIRISGTILAAVFFSALTAHAQSVPPEMDAWLKQAELGPYQASPENWDEVVRKAKEEGEVVVYSSSSRIAKVADAFMAIYPESKVTSFDLGSVQSVEKTVREQDAGLYNADIVT